MAIQAGQTADSGAGDVLLVPDGVSSPPVLTLDNYTYRGAGKGDAAIRYDASNPLTVVLVGNNSVTHAVGSIDTSAGFYSDYYADLSITGEGSLTVAGGNTNGRSYGVGSMGGNITISGGTVSATSGSAQYCAGIAGVGGVVISDAELEATGGVATVTISDEAKVEASGSADGVDTYGIGCGNGSISIDAGEVTVTGNNKACDGTVKNAVAGMGWTDAAGTQGKAAIEAIEAQVLPQGQVPRGYDGSAACVAA